jgi:ribose 1,5-bisphosphate isomerase
VALPEQAEKIAENIRTMRIRGAGHIASSAAEALRIVAESSKAKNVNDFLAELDTSAHTLLQTRPTAVSLPNAVRYVMHRINAKKAEASSVEQIRAIAIGAASEFIESTRTALQRIGEIGARRIRDGDVLLTHCNSSAVLSIMKTAWNQGKKFEVMATETRPRFQGRITAHELAKSGIPVTLILDDAVRYFIQTVDKVIVGADAITANGALVNKIGTSIVALAAHEAKVRVFVAAETYKFSPETMIGELVKIEERDTTEVISQTELERLGKVAVRNPSFDVTPSEFIDLIITERGIIPPLGAMLILQDVLGVVTPEELQDYQTYALQEEA